MTSLQYWLLERLYGKKAEQFVIENTDAVKEQAKKVKLEDYERAVRVTNAT